MRSRFAIVLLLIAAFLGMAMHSAFDSAHAATATHASCDGQAENAPDNPDGSEGVDQHCCASVCHAWSSIPTNSAAFSMILTRGDIALTTVRMTSSVTSGLRRPPRQTFVAVS
jgi:hypothetical protein